MTGCGQGSCGNCGGCDSCGSCGMELELTEKELALLRTFAQAPFLPVARRWDSETPVYLEEGTEDAGAWSAAVTGLEQKRLNRLDYDLPLTNFGYEAYRQYPCQGSMALTSRGQEVLDLLAIQGLRP